MSKQAERNMPRGLLHLLKFVRMCRRKSQFLSFDVVRTYSQLQKSKKKNAAL